MFIYKLVFPYKWYNLEYVWQGCNSLLVGSPILTHEYWCVAIRHVDQPITWTHMLWMFRYKTDWHLSRRDKHQARIVSLIRLNIDNNVLETWKCLSFHREIYACDCDLLGDLTDSWLVVGAFSYTFANSCCCLVSGWRSTLNIRFVRGKIVRNIISVWKSENRQ